MKENMYELGKYTRINKFDLNILKNKSDAQINEFLNGMLNDAEFEVIYSNAVTIIKKVGSKELFWGTLIDNLYNLILIPNEEYAWVFKFIVSLFDVPTFSVDKSYARKILPNDINAGDGAIFIILKKISDKAWFKNNKEAYEKVVIDIISDDMSPQDISRFFPFFKNMDFYYAVLKKTKLATVLPYIVRDIYMEPENIEDFKGAETVDYLLKTFKSLFAYNPTASTHLADIIRDYHSKNTAKLFLEMVKEDLFTDRKILELLTTVYDATNSQEIGQVLYNLTKDEKYLPEDVKDIFIF